MIFRDTFTKSAKAVIISAVVDFDIKHVMNFMDFSLLLPLGPAPKSIKNENFPKILFQLQSTRKKLSNAGSQVIIR